MPELRARDLWWAFLDGKPESEWNPLKQPKAAKHGNKRRRMQAFSDDDLDYGPEQLAQKETPASASDRRLAQSFSDEDLDYGSEHPPSERENPTNASDRRPREPTPSIMGFIDHVCFLL